MTLEEIGALFDTIVDYYPSFTGDLKKMQSWQTALKNTVLDQCLINLEEYAANPENKFPPHPGALATKRTEMDRYHEQMKINGKNTVESYEQLREGIAGPTDEQRRKVRELLG